jgi:hypothetical protein
LSVDEPPPPALRIGEHDLILRDAVLRTALRMRKKNKKSSS